MCAASSDKRAAHDTDASASCEEKQGRRDRRYNCDMPAAAGGALQIASLCQMLVCGVHVLGGYETLHDVSEENAHTEARDARCPHVSELKQSIYQVMTTEMCTPGWAKDARVPDSEARVPDSDVVLFPQKHPCLPTVYAAHVSSGFLCLDDRKRDDNKLFKRKNPQHCSAAVGTSTRAVARTFKSRTSTRAVVRTFKSHKNPSCSSVTVSLIVEVTVEKHRSAPGSAALELQGSGAPRAPATFNSFGSPLQATLSFPPSSRNQIACL